MQSCLNGFHYIDVHNIIYIPINIVYIYIYIYSFLYALYICIPMFRGYQGLEGSSLHTRVQPISPKESSPRGHNLEDSTSENNGVTYSLSSWTLKLFEETVLVVNKTYSIGIEYIIPLVV